MTNQCALCNICGTETADKLKIKYISSTMGTHLHSLKQHAAKVFPSRVFRKVRDEMLQKGVVIKIYNAKNANIYLHELTKFGAPGLGGM